MTRSALHYLERYPSTRANLIRVLERKVLKACRELELEPDDFNELIYQVADKCVRNGLVDDLVFAQSKASSLRRRGGSRRAVEAKLSAKGVDRQTIEAVLADDDQSDEEAALVFARRKRLGPFADPDKRAQRREKDLAAMCRAGFSYGIARRIVDTESADELLKASDDDRRPKD